MAYNKTIWKNKGELNAPEINKDNLNNIENGIGEVNLAGIVNIFAGAVAPTGWLICDGSAISRTTYAELFNAIGTVYGIGDGTTTFNIPNLKGKVVVGLDTAQTEFDSLGESGGAKTHTLSVNEIPSHKHEVQLGISEGGQTGRYASFVETARLAYNTSGEKGTTATGGGLAHNNLQPYQVLNYIIKF